MKKILQTIIKLIKTNKIKIKSNLMMMKMIIQMMVINQKLLQSRFKKFLTIKIKMGQI